METPTPRLLGRSGLLAGRLGLASSYGASAGAFEQAFEMGCNYFYWGSMRRNGMRDAIRHLVPKNREKMLVVLQSYWRQGLMMDWSVQRGLKQLKTNYADVLVLGWYNKLPNERILNKALELKEKGLIKKIAISCHHRPSFESYIKDPRFDLIMLRYNAAHSGAEREVFPFLSDQVKTRPGVISYTATRWGTLLDPKYTPSGLKTPTASDCYRFALSNPHVDVCLTGPANEEQMRANLKALELGPMSSDEMEWIRKVGKNVHQLTKKKTFTNPFNQRSV